MNFLSQTLLVPGKDGSLFKYEIYTKTGISSSNEQIEEGTYRVVVLELGRESDVFKVIDDNLDVTPLFKKRRLKLGFIPIGSYGAPLSDLAEYLIKLP